MRRFLYLFPLGMAAAFALIFGVGMGFVGGVMLDLGLPFPPGWEWASLAILSVLPLSPWLVLSPFIAGRTHRRTVQALDGLLANITTVSGREPARP
jgi:hypothetical protein